MSKHSIYRTIWFRILAAGAVASFSSGCGYILQARDHAVPTAVPAMRMAQTLNPEAGKNRKVVAGLDATVGKNVGDSYSKSFSEDIDIEGEFQGMSGLGQN